MALFKQFYWHPRIDATLSKRLASLANSDPKPKLIILGAALVRMNIFSIFGQVQGR